METMLGLLKIRVIKGINLVAKDTSSSDPYVIVTMGSQTVYDKDTFTEDDKLGDAPIDIKPYLECLRAGVSDLPTGTVVDKIHPNRENSLADISRIVWKDGKLVQDMILRLNNVPTGEVEILIEWANVPGGRDLQS